MDRTLLGKVSDWPHDPYPGARPSGCWQLRGDAVHRLEADYDLTGLTLLLAYGSNANPVKLAERLGEVIVLEATISDAQAVWSCSRRMRGDVVATIIERPGHTETCPVLAVTPDQLALIDAWEGAPVRYRRKDFWGTCIVNGREVTPQVYVGTDEVRPPLMVEGVALGLHEYSHDHVNELVPITAPAPASPAPESAQRPFRTS